MPYSTIVPELGHFAMALALCLALVQSAVPLWGAYAGNAALMRVARPAAQAQFFTLIVSFACLTWAFIAKDFSVLYVAQNANAQLPLHYRISAVWGAHEGSLLLWVLILAGWTFAVTQGSRSLPLAFSARVIAVLGLVSIGFLLFLLLTSNPFERLIPAAADGRDLNPLLQDPGLIIHPPMLYMGYVGMSVPFAFAIAALLEGRIDAAWTRWTRPWTLIAWVFLTGGITLGSWWAYYELGWGGWWFWDPVENASFMPWLVATALLHSLAVTEQRNSFKAWTLLLSIFGFSLSLLGTFLVRSGVLVSVHAFATDPARGIFILIFLAVVIGSALLLYAWRAGSIVSIGRFALVSRETLLLINNVLLLAAAFTILLGTLYPILYDAMGLGKLSIGPPYFNVVFVSLTLPLIALLPLGPLARWRQDDLGRLFWRVYKALLMSLLLGVVLVLLAVGPASIGVTLSLVLACWILVGSLQAVKKRLSLGDLGGSLRRLPRSFIGMVLAHLGVAVFVVGVTMVSHYEESEHVRLAPGESYELAGHRFELAEVREVDGPNYRAQRATIEVYRDQRLVSELHPEKRFYHSKQGEPMTEAGIDPGVTRDIYVALAEPLGDGAWAVRLNYKPYVRWIWFGPVLMVLGGILAASDRRYRHKPGREQTAA